MLNGTKTSNRYISAIDRDIRMKQKLISLTCLSLSIPHVRFYDKIFNFSLRFFFFFFWHEKSNSRLGYIELTLIIEISGLLHAEHVRHALLSLYGL